MNESILRQLLEGMPARERAEFRCSNCWTALEGARVAVVARSVYGTDAWELNTIYCLEHAPETVPETPHGESVLATARVGMLADVLGQSHDPALLDVEIVDAALGESDDEAWSGVRAGGDAT
jgi:hypothetical protein